YHFTMTGKFMLQEELGPFFRYGHVMIRKTIESLYRDEEPKWYHDLVGKSALRSVYQGDFIDTGYAK
ncbi:MAG: hypothetical protein RR572_08310, partial [Raoultibacter sp.]